MEMRIIITKITNIKHITGLNKTKKIKKLIKIKINNKYKHF
jgi:hypothetical protein